MTTVGKNSRNSIELNNMVYLTLKVI